MLRRRGAGCGRPPGRGAAQRARIAITRALLLPCRSDKVVVASAGMQADMKTLHKNLHYRHVTYVHNHNRPMSVTAVAQLLSNTLYYKRFFPYYTFNLVAGLDEEGERTSHLGTPLLRSSRRRVFSLAQRSPHAPEQGKGCTASCGTCRCIDGAVGEGDMLLWCVCACLWACRRGRRVQLRRHWLVRAQRLLLPGAPTARSMRGSPTARAGPDEAPVTA